MLVEYIGLVTAFLPVSVAVAGCSRAETFSQLSTISFAQPCILLTSPFGAASTVARAMKAAKAARRTVSVLMMMMGCFLISAEGIVTVIQ